MTKTDWQNILSCIDLTLRQTGLQNADVLVVLAHKVKQELEKPEPAKPDPEKAPTLLPE